MDLYKPLLLVGMEVLSESFDVGRLMLAYTVFGADVVKLAFNMLAL